MRWQRAKTNTELIIKLDPRRKILEKHDGEVYFTQSQLVLILKPNENHYWTT